MNEGKVLDQGRHVDLMNRNQFYASLIRTFLQEKEKTAESDNEIPMIDAEYYKAIYLLSNHRRWIGKLALNLQDERDSAVESFTFRCEARIDNLNECGQVNKAEKSGESQRVWTKKEFGSE